MYFIFGISLAISAITSYGSTGNRTVLAIKNQIVTLRTSIGVATVVQFPERPIHVISGDQSAHKIEYLEKSIAIKPLFRGAQSNLHVYTDSNHYIFRLITIDQSNADYVVNIQSSPKPTGYNEEKWLAYISKIKNDHILLMTRRIARTNDHVLLIEFEVCADRNFLFNPGWIWLTQNGKIRPIHNLNLSSQELPAGGAVKGIIQIREQDISAALPLNIELRIKKTSTLKLPRVSSWK